MDINEILLRITGDDRDASRSLEHIAALLTALDHVDANPSVDLNTGKAERDLTSFIALLRTIPADLNVKANLDDGEALGKFAALTSVLSQAGPYNIDVKLQDADALTNLAALQAGIAAVPNRVETKADADTAAATSKMLLLLALARELGSQKVNIDVETDSNQVRRAEQSLGGLLGLFDSLRGGLSKLGDAFGGASVNLGPFTTALNPLTAGAILIVLALIFQLIAALAAVAASAAAAAAAVAGLASAFLAALGPAVLVVVAAALRLAKILQVLQAQDQARQQSATKAAQGDQAATAAADARADAARNLGRANEDLARATVQAYRDMADAAEKVADAERDITRAKLGRQQADISLQQAQLDLKKFRLELGLTSTDLDNTFKKFTDVNFDPKQLNAELRKINPGNKLFDKSQELELKQKILDVKKARLAEKDATDAVKDSQLALNRAVEENNRYLRDNIKANQGYVSALRARDDAQRSLNRANRPVADTSALAKADTMTQKLSKSELALLAVIKDVRKFWNNMFGGATDAIMQSIASSLKLIMRSFKPLKPLITALGHSFGDMISNLATAFTDPGMMKQIQNFINLWIQSAGPLTQIMIDLVKIFMNFATAAAPFLVPALQAIADVFHSLMGTTQDSSKMGSFMAMIQANLKDWVYLFTQVGRVMLAFFGPAQEQGRTLVRWLGDGAKKLANMLNTKEGRQDLINFLKDSVAFAKDFFRAVKIVVGILIFTADVIQAIGAGVKFAFNAMIDQINRTIQPVKDLFKWIGKVWDKFKAFVADLAPKLAKAATDVFNAAIHLGENILNGIVKGIKDTAKKVADAAGGIAGKIVNGVANGLDLNSPSKVMIGMGKDVVEGLKIGIERGAVNLEQVAVAHLATPIISGVSLPNASVGAPSSTDNSKSVTIGEVNLQAPAGATVDGRAAAMLFMDEIRRRGR